MLIYYPLVSTRDQPWVTDDEIKDVSVHKEKKLCVLSEKTCGGGPQREETMCSLGKDLWRGSTKRRNYVFSRERLVVGVHKEKKLCVLSGKTCA
jgi:hypothetical protein